MDLPPRPTLARLAVAGLVVALLLPAGVSALTHDGGDFKRGTVTEHADGPTYVGIQGFHFQGQNSTKKPARLISVGPNATLNWELSGEAVGASWYYDVDPLPNGNLLVVSTTPEATIVYEMDPETREAVWKQELPIHDTHDVDLINGDELLVGNMRQWNNSTDRSDDRVFVYNLTTDEITWEWYFRDHFNESTDGGYHEDWSHVNDVDKVDENRYLVSPRNFDQVLLINRSTDEIEMRLGTDGEHSVLKEQHNPDFLVSDDGRPTLLVADSENDRVVEYERHCEGDPMTAPPEDCNWHLTWEVGQGQFNWPRDADRLQNGNTLVTDSLNHRVVEITPEGEIVWEYYATWGPYDAERPAGRNVSADRTGGSARGPTMSDLGATGSHDVTGSANDPPVPSEVATGPGALLSDLGFEEASRTWSHLTPWAKPVWMSGWDFLSAIVAGLLLVGWGATEVYVRRGYIRTWGDAVR